MSRTSDPLRTADGRLVAALTSREWLLTDGRGGYAFGTQAGLNTRKYHGLILEGVCFDFSGGILGCVSSVPHLLIQ